MAERPFQFARTMPRNPHYYTPRRKWENNDEFSWAAGFIYDHGYENKWWAHTYLQFDCNGFYYWPMRADRTLTGVINRKPLEALSPWDIYTNRPSFPAAYLPDHFPECGLEIGGSSLEGFERIDWSGKQRPDFITPLASFAPLGEEKYDFIASLYGAYLSPAEQNRIPQLLAPGGEAMVCYERHDPFSRSGMKVPIYDPVYPVDARGWACLKK